LLATAHNAYHSFFELSFRSEAKESAFCLNRQEMTSGQRRKADPCGMTNKKITNLSDIINSFRTDFEQEMRMQTEKKLGFATRAIHAGQASDPLTGR